MNRIITNIDEKRVYTELFNIYEQDFLQILDYIAPINNAYNIEWSDCCLRINLNVSWNKIHELHLRICSECENLMKSIIKKLYPEIDLDAEYLETKHKEVYSIINNLDPNQKNLILKNLNKHADMPFCLSILDKKIWICNKIIEFSKVIEVNPDNQIMYIQPFDRNNKDKHFPQRREHYNQIKHDKINNYVQCTLRDLINSLWAYYMLLNYFVLPINLPIYDNTKVKSIVYKPTIWRIDYPEAVRKFFTYFRDSRPWNFFKKVIRNWKEIIPSEYDDVTMEQLKPLIEEAENAHVLVDKTSEAANNYLKTENYFFYNSFVQYNLTHWFEDNQFEKGSFWKIIVETKLNIKNTKN